MNSTRPSVRRPPMFIFFFTSTRSHRLTFASVAQVDFASCWIGGGVLGSGLVQEEILFLMNPELIVSRLFTERLADNECLIITGSQQFSCYSGFGDSFEWAGPHEDRLQRDEWGRLKRQILAIDALHFKHSRDQYAVIQAYCGFKADGNDDPDIATGKWGCGAFNGDPQLKAVIQLMAAAQARRGLAFFTFGDEKLKQGLQQVHHLLVTEGITEGRQAVRTSGGPLRCSAHDQRFTPGPVRVHQEIHQTLQESAVRTDSTSAPESKTKQEYFYDRNDGAAT